eukprot:m.24665 g.24665  ORF g.24665 m.24665 type:complete len:58 (-) comp11302_c0_seq2:376-549(-)
MTLDEVVQLVLNTNRHQSNVVLFQYGFQHANLLTPVSAQLSPELSQEADHYWSLGPQ